MKEEKSRRIPVTIGLKESGNVSIHFFVVRTRERKVYRRIEDLSKWVDMESLIETHDFT